MKIAASDLALQSSHVAMRRQESAETLRAWRGERPDFEGLQSAIANISDAARQLLARLPAVPPAPTFESTAGQAQAIESASEAADNDPFLAMIKGMVEMLTGKAVRVFDMRSFNAEMRHVEVRAAASAERMRAPATGNGRAGWGMEYDAYRLHEEFEQTAFSASGTIRTADGQAFRFTLDLQMTRYYREESSVSIRAGDAVRKDPLVINFGGTAVELASHAGQRFLFDLDGDGEADLLPMFASGSGYLALDIDGNGRIDSGRELFGPTTGKGFEELARYDEDGNGWIDENDAVFDKLSVWVPAAEGVGALHSLAQLGIGAIGLAHVATPFALRSTDNTDLGLVKNTGLYLTESGRAGSVQEIDLTV
jgi:hypothetical protein